MKVHLNGALVDAHAARISPLDRGFVFGDGVYEGLRACEGAILGLRAHVERMREGLRESRIVGFDPESLGPRSIELLRANNLRDAFVYWQVSRGAPDPSTADPAQWRERTPAPGSLQPTVFAYCHALPPLEAYTEPLTRRVAVLPDLRWQRGHVKAISLMGGVLGAYDARERGCDDAVFVRDGFVTEGVATNVVVQTDSGLATPGVERGLILGGVTRRMLLGADPSIAVRPVREDELRRAKEVMLVGTSTMLVSVTHLDGAPVGDGGVGPVAHRLLRALVDAARRDIAASADAPYTPGDERSDAAPAGRGRGQHAHGLRAP